MSQTDEGREKATDAIEALNATERRSSDSSPSSKKPEFFMMKKSPNTSGNKSTLSVNAAGLRVQKEIDQSATPGVNVTFPSLDNLMHFLVTVKPQLGLYRQAEFRFVVDIPNTYPFDPPKVICKTTVYHPNIDLDGHVCLNILRADWKPVLTISSVLMGLLYLFQEPNPEDPLNKVAADEMLNHRENFERTVYRTLRGGHFFHRNFEKLL